MNDIFARCNSLFQNLNLNYKFWAFQSWIQFYFISTIIVFCFNINTIHAQDKVIHFKEEMFTTFNTLALFGDVEWKYTNKYDSLWKYPEYDDTHWKSIQIQDFSPSYASEDGKIEAWFRIKIKVDSSLVKKRLSIRVVTLSAISIYINGEFFKNYGFPHSNPSLFKSNFSSFELGDPVDIVPGEVYTIGVYFTDHYSHIIDKMSRRKISLDPRIRLISQDNNIALYKSMQNSIVYFWLGPLLLLSALFWFMYFQNREEKIIFLVAIFTTALFILCYSINIGKFSFRGILLFYIFDFLVTLSSAFAMAMIPLIIDKLVTRKISSGYRYIFWFFFLTNCIGYFVLDTGTFQWLRLTYVILLISISAHLTFKRRAQIITIQWVILIGMLLTIFFIIAYLLLILNNNTLSWLQDTVVTGIYLTMPISMLIYFTLRFKNNLDAARNNAHRVIQLSKEKERLIESQKSELEKQVKSRTEELVQSLEELKATQAQLIQSEKMASLGELTAGIAHEIQNPLNFVNNFSEVSNELIDEMNEELDNGDIGEAKAISADIKQNLEKINHHGKRADAIVKGMLAHSRSNKGEKELVNINALADEYLRLSYHGLRAKDKSFNSDFETDFDPNLPKVNVIPQDMGRVLLNLINNAFQAVQEQTKKRGKEYKAKVTLTTKNLGDKVWISVKDNGSGIPDAIKDKIFQPFFTTKPTGQGTGLGLSMSYDIIKMHGGHIEVDSTEEEGSLFKIIIPLI